MPKVSVIVPIYNVEKYLAECLNSLIAQTLEDIEIICINDGSNDGSYNILSDFAKKDSRIIVINQDNMGVSYTRNKGVEVAKGEYVAFIDSDDWVDVDYYEKLYNSAIKNKADVSVSSIIKTSSKYRFSILEYKEEKVFENYEDKLMVCGIPEKSYVWNKIYKRDKLLKSGIKFIEGAIYEDCIFTPQILFYTGKLVTVPGTNYYYFRHNNSLVRQKGEKAEKDFKNAQKEMAKFYSENNVDTSKFEVVTKKYKILGVTLYKTITKANKTKHVLFNFIKW